MTRITPPLSQGPEAEFPTAASSNSASGKRATAAKSGAEAKAKVKAPRKKTASQVRAEAREEALQRAAAQADADFDPDLIRVRRMHRRDINRVWEFLKRVFRDVNQKTVEYQRPRSKQRFEESYDDEGIEQLVFEHGSEVVGYAESTFETTGSDNWINWRWFDNRDMRPLFVEELAVHPDYQGRGVGSYMLEQLRHIGALRGCTHLVLEVAENNEDALAFYRKRNFHKIDAAIFLAHRIDRQPELLPPRSLKPAPPDKADKAAKAAKAAKTAKATKAAKAAKAIKATKAAKATKATKAAKAAKATKPTRVTVPSKPTPMGRAAPSGTLKLVTPIKPPKAAKPRKPAQPAKPARSTG